MHRGADRGSQVSHESLARGIFRPFQHRCLRVQVVLTTIIRRLLAMEGGHNLVIFLR